MSKNNIRIIISLFPVLYFLAITLSLYARNIFFGYEVAKYAPPMTALIFGTVYIYFAEKFKHENFVTLCGILFGILSILIWTSVILAIIYFIGGITTDIIRKRGHILISYIVFSSGIAINYTFLPLLQKDPVPVWAEIYRNLMNYNFDEKQIFDCLILTIVCTVAGATLGKFALNKTNKEEMK